MYKLFYSMVIPSIRYCAGREHFCEASYSLSGYIQIVVFTLHYVFCIFKLHLVCHIKPSLTQHFVLA